MRLVVSDAARVDATVPDFRFELPEVQRIRWLHVIVAVEENCRLVRSGVQPRAEHHRVAACFQHTGGESGMLHELAHQYRGLANADVLGTDARLADEGEQAVEVN
jgi:hypothetical protein